MQRITFSNCIIQTINIIYNEKGEKAMDEEKKKEIKPGRELYHITYFYYLCIREEVYKLKALHALMEFGDFDEVIQIDTEAGQGIAKIIKAVIDSLDSFWKELQETNDLERERMQSGVLADPQGYFGGTQKETIQEIKEEVTNAKLDRIIELTTEKVGDKSKAIDTLIAVLAARKATINEAPATTLASEAAGAKE